MPRNGSGTYTAPSDSFNPAVAGTPIDPDDWNDTQTDYVDALTDSLSRTAQGGMLANLDHGAFSSLYTEIATPTNPSANILKVYAVDVAGVTKLASLNSVGTQTVFGSGTGDVVGPASATDGGFTKFDGTTGKLIKNSAAVIGVADGGTNISSYAVGDILYASGATTLSKLADVATGNALISGGITTAPAWGKIGLTTHVSGILPEANGGTNQSTYTTGDILYASASNTLSKLADVAAGSYLRSGGVTTAPVWSTTTLPNSATTGDILQASASNVYSNLNSVATGNALLSGGVGTANSWGKIGLTTHITGVLPVANGGTNASSASITAFNNITGYTAAGATGTTSTNLVFSTSPTFITPVLGVASADSLTVTGSSAPANGIYLQAANNLGFSTNSTLAAQFDSSQRLLINATASVSTAGVQSKLQISNNTYSGISMLTYDSTGSSEAFFYMGTSRGASIGTQTIVQNGDPLGGIFFGGSDGTAFRTAANILCMVDGTPGASDMPGRMDFYTTPDGSATGVIRARMDNAGNTLLGYNGTTGVIATNATSGMPAIPTCAGAKTGTPTAYTGMSYMVYDTTNNKLYMWNPTGTPAWKSVTLA